MSLIDITKKIDEMIKNNIYTIEEQYDILYYEFDKSILSLYFSNNYDYVLDDMRDEHKKRRDDKFKKDVKYRYNESCIITGNDMDSCDIAHIVPFCDSTEFEKYDVDNGLILSKDLHALFDKNLLKINPDTLIIEISPEKLQNKKNTCNQYHGLKINVNLTKNTIQYLRRIYNY